MILRSGFGGAGEGGGNRYLSSKTRSELILRLGNEVLGVWVLAKLDSKCHAESHIRVLLADSKFYFVFFKYFSNLFPLDISKHDFPGY